MNNNNFIGKTFGMLTVLSEVPKEKRKAKGNKEWYCQCKCGHIVQVRTAYLNNGHTTSCGCYRKIKMSETMSKNLLGQKFHKLTVIEKTEERANDGCIIWKCMCDCGNIYFVSTNLLRREEVWSCGCLRSKGEQKINQNLFENNYNYQTQFWFSDLKDKGYLYFDFALLDENKNIIALIEYQGIQHYKPEVLHGSWTNTPQKHDKMKKEYCKQHDIKLIEIPYTDYDKLDNKYIEDKLSQ